MNSKELLKLKPSEVHIWSASLLTNKFDITYFEAILSADERERAKNFRFLKDKKQFVVARYILRCLLSRYLGQSPGNIEFTYGISGKPAVSSQKQLYFNVSHSGDYALYAVTSFYEVGIDLEYIDKSLELEDMALHVFSPAEFVHWETLELEEKVNSFFTNWVCKEAFLKASGIGWLGEKTVLPLNVKVEPQQEPLNDGWTNPYCFECIPGYASALFVEGPPLRPIHFSWSEKSLQCEEL